MPGDRSIQQCARASESAASTVDDAGLRKRLRRDVGDLASHDRRTTSAGERSSAALIAERLQEVGADEVDITTFRTQSSWVPAHLVHITVGIVAGLLPGRWAQMVGAGVAASYELDVSGRSHWLRHLLPAAHGVSVTARLPPSGTSRRTLVLVAHHDAAHTGLVWHPHSIAASRALSRRTGHTIPSHTVALGGLATSALPFPAVRLAARATLGLAAILMIQSMRTKTAPGANDNATGVAAVLELVRRLRDNPLTDTTVILVFPGGEESGSTGMRAWARRMRPELDPQTTLAVNLDAVGSGGHLAVSRREGLTGRLAARDVEFAKVVASRADITLRSVTIANPTDAAAARLAGLRTISLLSLHYGWISNLHRRSDTVANVGWDTVEDAVLLTEQIARTWNERTTDDD